MKVAIARRRRMAFGRSFEQCGRQMGTSICTTVSGSIAATGNVKAGVRLRRRCRPTLSGMFGVGPARLVCLIASLSEDLEGLAPYHPILIP